MVREGVLPCGLTYHIVSSPEWTHLKSETRLVLPVGSLDERGVSGVAHFLEHMAIRSTEHFPDGAIRRFIESCGGAYGYDLNALTGYDRTIFLLSTPADSIGTALRITRDWLGAVVLTDEKAVDQERRVILEELRGASTEERDRLLTGVGRASRRPPLGSSTSITEITSKDLRAYYADHYRPAQAHLVVVGATPAEEVERAISELYSDLREETPLPRRERERLEYAPTPICRTDTDSVYSSHRLRLLSHYPTTPQHSPRREGEDIVTALLSHLLYEIDGGSIVSWHYLSGTGLMELEVTGETEEELCERLRRSLSLIRTVGSRGLGQSADYLRERVARRERERGDKRLPDDGDPATIAQILTDEILDGRQVHSLRELTPDSLDDLARRLFASWHPDILLYRSGRGGELTADHFLSLLQERGTGPIPRLTPEGKEDTTINTAAPLPRPSASEISPERVETIDALGVTIALYPGGHRLVIKSLRDPEEPTRILSSSPGGWGPLGGPDLTDLIAAVDGADDIDLLYGHGLSVGSAVGASTHGYYALSQRSDGVPGLMQYLYQKFNSPRVEPLTASDEGERTSLLARLLERDPATRVSALADTILGRSTPFTTPKAEEEPAALYRRLYSATAGGYTLICSPIAPDSLISLYGRSLAHLTGSLPLERYGEIPGGSGLEQLTGEGETLSTHLLLWGSYHPSLREGLLLKVLREILRGRQIDRLRGELGLVYSPAISLEYTTLPDGSGRFLLHLDNTVLRANEEQLIRAVEELLQETEVSPERLEEIKRGMRTARATALASATGADWMDILTGLMEKGESVEDFAHYDEILRSITADEVGKYRQQLLTTARHKWITY